MKLVIKKELLLDGLNKVSHAISSKNLIPVLAGIKFDLKKNKLTLTASDNDITIETVIESKEKDDFKVEEEGSIIISGKYILEIVRKIPDKFINIDVVDDLKIMIYTENSEYDLNGISENEYPSINLEESKKKIEINSKVFRESINETAFATSTEETKPILTGINFKITGNTLEFNSTDSYRLARKIITLDKASDDSYNIVVPSHNLLEFTRIMDEDDKAFVELHIFNSKILFKYKDTLFQSRLISGTYPNTSNLLPDSYYMVISANLNELYSVIDRASILTSDKDKNTVTLETSGNTLIVKSNSVEIGRVEEKMGITKNIEDDIKISFSAKYMMDALKAFSTDTVEINYVGEIKPIILKSKEKENLTELVLPIRTY